jgi:subfamily B ATP-binding cassette protein MsbA
MSSSTKSITWREKVLALSRVAKYRPKYTVFLVLLGAGTAGLEGIGLGFIYPILQVAQSPDPISQADGVLGRFLELYNFLGIPFELKFLILGVATVMTVRFSSSFIVDWMKVILEQKYKRDLKRRAFDAALDAKISYFDEEGSDDILNAIITETRYSGDVIKFGVQTMETLSLALVYLGVMFYIAPGMTIYALALLGGITYVLRNIVEPAYTVGGKVAVANEQLQKAVQAGTQGIRDTKLFNIKEEIYNEFNTAVRSKTSSEIELAKNESGIQNFYDLASALTLFSLIYIGFVYSGLDLGALGIFLLAMFRLSPVFSRLNSQVYNLEGRISHLIRTIEFVDGLENRQESSGSQTVSKVSRVEFDNVSFSYEPDDPVLKDISFDVNKGEFIAFVGQSGAGKSTIASLFTRLYDPDAGEIRGDGTPISEYDLTAWRERVAVVRQKPFIFNDTLKNNITIANRDASQSDIKRVSEIAKIDEFIHELPNGYDSQLGDDGVRLSGGQRQRVALARALLKDADFLLLDEATSDLDSSLEREVQDAIETMNRDYGILTIAHRLSTVKNADCIYTIKDGKIVEKGTHKKLISDRGKYYELHTIQSEE